MGVLKAWNGTAWEEIAVSGTGEFLPLAGGSMEPGAVIQFPNEADVPKINLYSNTFGLGITSGSTVIFASSTIRFRQNSVDGTEWAYIDASGLGPHTNVNVTWMNGFSGTGQFRVNPASVTLSIFDVGRNVDTAARTGVQMCGLPAGVPAPWRTLRAEATVMSTQWDVAGTVLIEMRNTGIWLQCHNDFALGDNAADFQKFDLTLTWTR